ncbi:MAG: carboxylesterase family protein [Metallibacterium sp.]
MSVVERTAHSEFVERSLVHDGELVRYRIHVPTQGGTLRPVLLFLHGSGERGMDNIAQTRVGLGPALLRGVVPLPLLAVFPQLPPGASWQGVHARRALAALEDACAHRGGDGTRVALSGLSRGGYGVWELALLQPARYRALIPICAGLTARVGSPDLRVAAMDGCADPWREAARRLAHIPSWIVHGARDDVIPVEQSRRMAAALRDAGAPVHYRELPEANHNAWDAAYADARLWQWLQRMLN